MLTPELHHSPIPTFSVDLFGTKPWLILGKGPTAAVFSAALHHQYNVIALNHAMRGMQVEVGHAVDIEVFEHLKAEELTDVRYLCLPWIPHVRHALPLTGGKVFFGPGRLTLLEHCKRVPVLQTYLKKGRLLTYNFCTSPEVERRPDLPLVQGKTFSAAVVTHLLALAGVRCIRTLGVDGGSAYSTSFADLEDKTKLQAVTKSNFDVQFAEISEHIQHFNLDFGPLQSSIPAKIFVGCMPEQELAFQVLAYSIQRHASISVRVMRLHECIKQQRIHIPVPSHPENQARTPFSFQRFAIPALCDYIGRALYLDSDMLVLKDLRTLWNSDMGGMQMLSVAPKEGSGRQPQFSVMLIDAKRLGWRVEEIITSLNNGDFTYAQLMHEMASVPLWRASIPATWNSLELYEPSKTHLIHFTDMDGQPWLNPLHPHAALWSRYLLDAVSSGVIDRLTVKQEVACGNVRPSLLAQLERGLYDPKNLPLSVLQKDFTAFLAPHRRTAKPLSRTKHELYRAKSLMRFILNDYVVGPLFIHGPKQLVKKLLVYLR